MIAMVKALDAIKRQDTAGFQKFLGLTIAGGIIFLGLQAYEWNHLINGAKIGLAENPFGAALFGTTFYMITGFHGMHVTGGVIYLAFVFWAVHKRNYASDCYNLVENVGLYWHFVDLVWIFLFPLLYLF